MKRSVKILVLVFTILVLQSFTPQTAKYDRTVYICVTGKVYHSTLNCRGLRKATHEIKAVPLSEAAKTRRACKICF